MVQQKFDRITFEKEIKKEQNRSMKLEQDLSDRLDDIQKLENKVSQQSSYLSEIEELKYSLSILEQENYDLKEERKHRKTTTLSIQASIHSLQELFALKLDLFEKRMDFALDRLRVLNSIFSSVKKQLYRSAMEKRTLEMELDHLRQDRKILVKQLMQKNVNPPRETTTEIVSASTETGKNILLQDMDTLHKLQILDQLSTTLLQIL
jgi:regulator of replication initiation timing